MVDLSIVGVFLNQQTYLGGMPFTFCKTSTEFLRKTWALVMKIGDSPDIYQF